MFQQRVWILQRSNIEILRECQRLIMDQFAERISLTQSDIIDRIFYFHGKSSNQRFHEAVERLKMSLMEAAFDLRQLPSYEEPEGPHSFQPDTYQPAALHADTSATASTQPPKNRPPLKAPVRATMAVTLEDICIVEGATGRPRKQHQRDPDGSESPDTVVRPVAPCYRER